MIEKGERITKEYLESAEGRAHLTYLYRDLKCTDNMAADQLGVTRKTLYNWKMQSAPIRNAMNLGKGIVDTMVENKLLESALNGNVTAMIFWLSNRKGDKWKHLNQIANKNAMDTNIVFTFEREKKGKKKNEN